MTKKGGYINTKKIFFKPAQVIDFFILQRAALGAYVTKITLESFLAWKKRKRQEKISKAEQDMERRKADFKAGKALVVSSTLLNKLQFIIGE